MDEVFSFKLNIVVISPMLGWAESRDSFRRIASESYRGDSNH